MNLELNISKIDHLVLQLDLLINYTGVGTQLNRKKLIYLAYLYLYGEGGSEKILEDGVSLNAGVWHNHLWEFRKQGLVVGKKKESTLNPAIKISLDNNVINLNINAEGNGSL